MSDRFTAGIRADATGVSLDVVLRDSSGAEVTGKVHTDVTAYYWRQGGSPTSITMATLASISASWSSGGFREADAANMPGSYRLDVPDAAFASGADWVEINVKVSGALVFKERFFITSEAMQTGDSYAVVAGGTNGNAAIKTLLDTIAGFIDTEVAAIKAKTDQMTFSVSGQVDANVLSLSGIAAAAAALANSGKSVILGTVGSGSTTTSVVTSSLTPPAVLADQFKGRVLIFLNDTPTTGLRGQGAPLSGSSAGGVLSIATGNALTTSPAPGDLFIIV